LSQLRQRASEFEELDVRVKVVTFDADYMARVYVQETNLSWPLLLDPDQELYAAYGMTQGSWWSIYKPVSIWNYLKLIARGQKPGKPGKDWRQLGGDILIDPQQIIRLHHVSTGPHDRPEVQSILNIIKLNIIKKRP